MKDTSRYADTAQARESEYSQQAPTRVMDAFHPDAPLNADDKDRRQLYDASRRAQLAVAMVQLESFFGCRP